MIIDQAEFSRLVDVGLAAAHLGDVARARDLFENLLRYKEHAPARIGLALTYLVVGDFDKAADILKDEVLASHPDDAEALALLGLAESFAGRSGEGVRAFERVPRDSAAGKLVEAVATFK